MDDKIKSVETRQQNGSYQRLHTKYRWLESLDVSELILKVQNSNMTDIAKELNIPRHILEGHLKRNGFEQKGKFKRSNSSWIKGKTKETDPRVKELAEKLSDTRKQLFAEGKLQQPDAFMTPEQIQERQKKGEQTRLEKYGNTFGPSSGWNKGLTKETDERVAKNAEATSKGKTGVPLSEEHRQHLSEACAKSEEVQQHILNLNKNFHTGRKRSEEFKRIHSETSPLRGKTLEEIYGVEEANRLKELSRQGRMNQKPITKETSIERAIFAELTLRNIVFEKHWKIKIAATEIDAFIQPNICIYADGDYWHHLPDYIVRDARQNKILLENGYKVFRFWQHDIKKDVKACVDQIEAYLNE